MKETIRKIIDNRVFTKDDIIRIGEIIENQKEENSELDSRSTKKYVITCDDSTSYESGSLSIITDEDIIDVKKTQSIEMSYHNYASEKSVDIELFHNGPRYINCRIAGNDRNWVNGTLREIEEKIKGTKPQDNFFLRHPVLLYNVSAFGIGILLSKIVVYILLSLFGGTPSSEPDPYWLQLIKSFPILGILINWAFYWLFGAMTFASNTRNLILELWPSTEFDFGPEHLKLEKKRRNTIVIVLTVVIIPILVSFIYDIIKITV